MGSMHDLIAGWHRWSIARVVLLFFVLLAMAAPATAANSDKEFLKRANRIFGPLPESMATPANPITPEKIILGKMLFYEPRISADGTVSCAKCHPVGLYAADGLRKSIGNECKPNPRNAPTIFNAATQISAHWIGNRTGVEDQAKQAVVGPPSFGMPSYEAVEKKLKEIKGYEALFRGSFPDEANPLTIDNFAKAIGAFERTLVTPSAFDAFLNGKKGAFTEAQKYGLKAFMDTGCAGCHSSPFVGGQMYQKFGVLEAYWKYTKSDPVDDGRYTVTKDEKDRYLFKVPVLRNVERTAPYFHDGTVDKLEDAVLIMGKVQLGKTLTKEQTAAIVSFLKSLTGELPDHVLTVPVLPSTEYGLSRPAQKKSRR
jgi:cytochrome c peroxidase